MLKKPHKIRYLRTTNNNDNYYFYIIVVVHYNIIAVHNALQFINNYYIGWLRVLR